MTKPTIAGLLREKRRQVANQAGRDLSSVGDFTAGNVIEVVATTNDGGPLDYATLRSGQAPTEDGDRRDEPPSTVIRRPSFITNLRIHKSIYDVN